MVVTGRPCLEQFGLPEQNSVGRLHSTCACTPNVCTFVPDMLIDTRVRDTIITKTVKYVFDDAVILIV